MRVIHGSWLIEIERNRSRTILRLFCYDFTAVALLNDQPGVVGVNARPITKPAVVFPVTGLVSLAGIELMPRGMCCRVRCEL